MKRRIFRRNFRKKGQQERIVIRICIADSGNDCASKICDLLERELDTKRISNSIDIASDWKEIDEAVSADPGYQMFIICIASVSPSFDWRRLARDLRRPKGLCKLVFVSDRLEDAEEIFEFFPYFFIYRSNLEYRIPQLVEHAFAGNKMGERKMFTTKLVQYAVNYDDIIFCEHLQRKTQLVCERFTINVNEKLADILEELPSEFVQTHSSFIVNMNHVRGLGKNGCTMDNGTVVPVSRSRFAEALDAFEHHVNQSCARRP